MRPPESGSTTWPGFPSAASSSGVSEEEAGPCFQLRRRLTSDTPVAVDVGPPSAGSWQADSGEMWQRFLAEGDRLERENARSRGADADGGDTGAVWRVGPHAAVRRAALRKAVAGVVGALAALALLALAISVASRGADGSARGWFSTHSPEIELMPRLPGEVLLRRQSSVASVSLPPSPPEVDGAAATTSGDHGDLEALDSVLAPLCSSSNPNVQDRANLARAMLWAQQGRTQAASARLRRLARSARTPAVRRQARAAEAAAVGQQSR